MSQSEDLLRQSEERLRLAQAVAHIGTFEWNIQTGVNIWTPELEAMYGLPPGGFPGTQAAWEQLVHPDDRAAALRSVERAFETGLLTESEWRVVWSDGSVHWLEGRFQVFRDTAGKPLRLTGVNIDVTEHKLADDERQKFVSLADASVEFIGMCDREFQPIYLNAAGLKMLGLEDLVTARHFRVKDCFFPEDQPFITEEFFPRVMREGQGEVEIRFRHFQTGAAIWILYNVFNIRDASGAIVGWATVSRNIHDRKCAGEEIRRLNAELEERVRQRTEELGRSNEELRHAQQALEEIVAKLALPPRHLDLDALSFRLGQFSLSDMTACSGAVRQIGAASSSAEEFARRLVQFFQARLRNEQDEPALPLVRFFETRPFAELDDELRSLVASLLPQAAPTTRCLTLIASAGERPEWNDPRKSLGHRVIPLLSAAAVERMPMLTQLVRQLGIAVGGILNPDPQVLLERQETGVFHVAEAIGSEYIPAQATFVVPYGIKSVVGFGDLLPDGRLFVAILFSRVAISRDLAVLIGHLALSTRMALLAFVNAPNKTADQITSVDRLLHSRERIVAEQEKKLLAALADQARTNWALERSNRDLGQFAFAASHDLQEPLRTISSYLELLVHRYQTGLDEKAREWIDIAVDGAERMKRLIHDLLEYSRVGSRTKAMKRTDAAAALHAALANLRAPIRETGAHVSHGPMPTVVADEQQLMRLFQNLISNALKFRGEQPPQIRVSAEPQAGEWVFCVADNGIGIDPQFAERIFVIFQRLHTDAEYPGTGIGLAICKRIIERHGGKIWVESLPGKGAKFYFTIPASEELDNAEAQARSSRRDSPR